MIEIRKATTIELDLLTPLFDGYRTFYSQSGDMDKAREFLASRIKNKESVIFIAIETVDGIEKGAGFVQLYPLFSSVSMQSLWLLNDLFVHSDYRKKGIAESLMRIAVDMAKADGAKGLMLETGIDNIPAQKLYEKLGWLRTKDYYMYTFSEL